MSNFSSSTSDGNTTGSSPPKTNAPPSPLSPDGSDDSPSSESSTTPSSMSSSPPSPSSNSPPPSPSSSSPPNSIGSPPSSNSPPPPSSNNNDTPTPTPPSPSDDDDSPTPPPNSKSPPPSSESPPSPPSNNPPPPPSNSANGPPSPTGVAPPPPDAISPPSSGDFDDSAPVVIKPSPISKHSPPNPATNAGSTSSTSSDSTQDSPSNQSVSSSSTPPSKDSSSSSNGLGIGLAIGVAIVLFAIFFVVMKRKRRRDALDYRPPTSIAIDGGYYRQANQMGGSTGSDPYNFSQPQSGASGVMSGSNRYGFHSGPLDPTVPTGSKSWFTYEELVDVTDGFCQENMIGEGGFGCVYKGTLPDGRKVAVKQLKAGSGQGEREFSAEVEIISRVHHRHLVSLVGYCIAEHHRLLVYEFLPNNTLEHHLHGTGSLDWPKRMRIAIGSAKGLAYLHEDCHPKIIHRDIKSANILLEDSFEPQVADFGLAKLSNDTHTHVSTRVMGTFGYMAPEYASSGKLTDRSDVFSFGVVLLEIITGRKPVDTRRPLGDESLVEWARPLLVHALETGNSDELVDPRLEGKYNKIEMFNMIEAAAACVRHSAPKRPRMVQVVRSLDNQDEIQDLSNGIKYGQSQAFNSGQYSTDIQKFRHMAFNDAGSYEFDSDDYDRRSAASGEFRSREHKLPNAWRPAEQSSGELPMFQSERSTGSGNYRYNGRFPS